MEKQRSLFGINLLLLFILSLLLCGFGSQFSEGWNILVSLGGSILFVIFLFGLLYGFFRMLGMRSAELERFYGHFPLGFGFGSTAVAEAQAESSHHASTSGPSFDWRQLCSFRTLRYAGVVLIVTAVFSLLFNIDWTLFTKICTAVGLGILFFGCAEWLRSIKKMPMASVSSLIGFALFQFALTLLFFYAVEQDWAPLFQNSHTWLALKFLMTCAFLFTLWRYQLSDEKNDTHAVLYFTIAYCSPLTLTFSGAILGFPPVLVFVALMSAMVLFWNGITHKPSLVLLNAGFANLHIAMLYRNTVAIASAGGTSLGAISTIALVAYFVFFVVQLIAAIVSANRAKGAATATEYVHLLVIHLLVVLGLVQLQPDLWFLTDYLGFGILGAAMLSFAASLVSRERVPDHRFNEMFMNLSIILSAVGLFLQTTGQWSAVVFLVYACAILWYSLYSTSIRTRIYGFLILGVSLVKLYFQFSEIFSSIPGSVAILLIGVFLVGLSYKFEAIKDLVMEGIGHDRK